MNKLLVLLISVMTIVTVASPVLATTVFTSNFETGSFASEGWTVANGAQANKWWCGAATNNGGTYGGYISDDVAGATCNYNVSSSSVTHIYRDVAFPVGETSITLAFDWKCYGEGGSSHYDYMQVFLVPTTTTPIAGTQLASGQIGSSYYELQSTYTTASVTIPCTNAGTTQRLVFSWRNDGSLGTQPPAAIDNLSLTTATGLSGTYSVDNTLPTGGSNYASFTAAISALNTSGVGAGGVTLNVVAGQTFVEDTPAIAVACGGAILFQRSGVGANPVVKPTGSAGTSDFGLCISGSDNVTFDGIDVAINSGSAVEYGYLVRNATATNGAQNCTVKNCKITLNRSNTSSIGVLQTTSTTGGGVTPTAAGGANSFNKYYNLTIENVYDGMYLLPGTSSFPDLSCEIGSVVGGTTTIGAATPNDIGNSGTRSWGVRATSQSGIKVFGITVRNVTVTSGVFVDGIFIENSQGASEVYGNTVRDLKSTSTSTSSVVYGIRVDTNSGATTKVYNNDVFSLTPPAPSSATATQVLRGMAAHVGATTGTVSFYFNSVRLDQGTALNGSSAAFYSQSGTVNLQDNIFANMTGNQTTAKHYAAYISSGTLSLASNNIYYAPNTNGVLGYAVSADRTLLEIFAAATSATAPVDGNEGGSANANPGFTGAADLTFSGSTPAAGSGVALAGITTDITGAARGTPPDVGAHETANALTDASAPVLSGVTITSGATPSVSVNVTDNSAAGSNAPIRLWYRLGSSGAFTGVDADSKPVGAMNGTYTWNTSLTGLATGTYQFYIATRDGQGAGLGLWANPIWTSSFPTTAGWSASDPPNYGTNPAAFANTRSFAKLATLAGGIYLVGSDEPVLKKLTDVAAQLTSSVVLGDVTYELKSTYDGTTGETFPIVFNQFTTSGGNWTVTIRPQAGVGMRTTSGSSTSTVIKLNGADRVTLDGRAGGTGTLSAWTVANTSTASATAAIWLSSLGTAAGATNNTLKYLTVSCGVDQSAGTNETFAIITSGTTIGTTVDGADNDSNTFANNTITKATWGIYLRGSSSNTNDNCAVSGNLVGPSAFGTSEIGKGGIVLQYQNLATVAQNEVRFVGVLATQTSGSSADRVGIGLGDAGWTPTSTTTTNCSVTRNLVHDVVDEKTYSSVGIVVGGVGSPSGNLIANNMVYQVRANGTSGDQGVGIGIGAGDGDKVVYNTIYLTGDIDPGTSTTATQSEAGIRIVSTPSNLTLKDNIVDVDVTSNTAGLKHYAIVAPSAYGWGTGGSNNNDYYVNPANAQMVLGGIGTSVPYTDVATLAAWRSQFTPSQDGASVNANPPFRSVTDLRLQTGTPTLLESGGTAIAGVNDDYEGDIRYGSAGYGGTGTAPDVGADEGEYAPVSLFDKRWDGGAGTTAWFDDLNWIPDGVPLASQTVGLSAASATTINVNGAGVCLDLTIGTNVAVQLGSGSLTLGRNFEQSGGSLSLGSGTLEVKGNFSPGGGSFSAGSGTTIFSGTTAQAIGGGVSHYNLVLRNGGAGQAKTFVAGSSVLYAVSNDLTVESTAQLALSSATATTLSISGNLNYAGIGGGANIGSLTINLTGTGKTINGASSAKTDSFAKARPEPGEVRTVVVDMRTDPSRLVSLVTPDGEKAARGLANTYAQKVGEVRQLIENADPTARLVINLDDMTLVKNPTGTADLLTSPTFDVPVVVASGASYTLGDNISIGTGRTLSVTGRLNCGTYSIGGGGGISVNGTTGVLGTATTSASGLGATVVTTGTNTYNDGSIIEYNAVGDQTVHSVSHPAASMLYTAGSGTKTLDANLTIGGNSGSTISKAALWVAAGSTFGDGGYRLTFTSSGYDNVNVIGGYSSTGSGSISFESGPYLSIVQAVDGTAFGDLLVNFSSSSNSLYIAAPGTSTVNMNFRNTLFGGTAGSGTAGGLLKLSYTGTTNLTVTGNVSLAPATVTNTGGGFGGYAAGSTNVVTLQGNLTSTSTATTQPIFDATGTNTFVFGGSAGQTITIPQSTTILTGVTTKMNNAAGLSLGGASPLTYTVGGTLNLASGNIVTGIHTLAIGTAGSVARTSGHIEGNLLKNVATGTSVVRTFEVGTGSDYAPVSVTFASVSTAGNLAATTAAGDHAQIATSGLDPARTANRTWTMTNAGVGFTNYDATLIFVSGDLDLGADPNLFYVGKYNAPNWTLPTVGAKTLTSTQATGLTSFSDFAVGQKPIYTILASAGSGGLISPSGSVQVEAGATQSFSITANPCYAIADVVVDDVSQGAIATYAFADIEANHTIVASFALRTYTITATAGTGGTITPNGAVVVNCGADQAFTIAAGPCYVLTDVKVDSVSQGAIVTYEFTNVQANHTIEATFAPKTYTITATAGTGGGITPSGAVVVNCGADQGFTITPADCYDIADVKVDNASQGAIGSYTFTDVLANHTINATFVLRTYTITASAGAGGSITPSGAIVVNCGADQGFTMTPNIGYAISDVLVDGSSQGQSVTYTFTDVQANHTIAASFTPDAMINAGPASGIITVSNGTVTVPVSLTRSIPAPVIMGFSVTFRVAGPILLPAGKSSITLPPGGGFLNANGGRNIQFTTLDNGDGTFTADGVTLGQPCGSNALAGILFNIAVGSSSSGGTGTITVENVLLRTCVNQPVAANIGTDADVLVDRSAPVVTVTVPNGGEIWFVGDTKTITWTGSDPEGFATYDVAYSIDGGGSYTPIATSLPGTQTSYDWVVPAPGSTTARVQVTAHDIHANSGSDASDADFTINFFHTITATAGTGGQIAPSGAVSVAHGADQPFAITADPGYHILDVVVDTISQGPLAAYTFYNVITDHTIDATFALDPVKNLDTGLTYATIQAAIDAPETDTGHHIQIDPGTYPGSIDVSKGIYLQGAQLGNDACTRSGVETVIDGLDNPSGTIRVTASNVTIDGLKVVNSKYGIFAVVALSNLTVRNTMVDDATDDGVMLYLASTALVERSKVTNCGLTGISGGEGATNPTTATIRYNCIENAMLGISGYLSNSTILQNEVKNYGGAPPCAGIGGQFVDTAVTGNTVSGYIYGAGIGMTLYDGRPVGSNVAITGNFISGNGAGIYFDEAQTLVGVAAHNNDITANLQYGALNLSAATFDATCNWWGSVAGPVSPNGVTGPITYKPWLSGSITGSPSCNLPILTITATAGPGGSIDPIGSVPVNYGNDQDFTITPDPCYDIADVKVDNVSQGPLAAYNFTNVTADHTITATFVLRSYTIAASAGTGGGISPSGDVPVDCGADQAFTITPEACYAIADVKVDDVSQGPIATYTFDDVATDHTIAATFTLKAFTIAASAGTGGGISPSGNVTVDCGEDQEFTITPGACYDILDVIVDGTTHLGSVGHYTFTNVTADHTIAASFVIKTYTIAASAGAGGVILPSAAVSVDCGSDQGFTISPNPGYHILDVVVDTVSQGQIAAYTFLNVTADHTISATFAKDPVTNLNTGLSYLTIQAAIDAPLTQDTHVIQIDPGMYPGAVVVDKQLTLQGAQAGNDACTRSGVETVIDGLDNPSGTVQVKASNVTLDGLKVVNSTFAIFAMVPCSNLTVVNTIVDDASNGIMLFKATTGTVERCKVSNCTVTGISGGDGEGNATTATIDYNCVDHSRYGISGYLLGSTIDHNMVTTYAEAPPCGGIAGQFVNTTITANTISGYPQGVGIGLGSYAGRPLASNVAISGNTISGNGAGIYADADQTLLNVAAHNNDILASLQYGLLNLCATTFDATCNWWGTTAGPTGTNGVSGPVTHMPWLNGSITGSPTCNLPLSTLTVHVVGNGTVGLVPIGGTYDYGTSVQLTAYPAGGWHFVQWDGDASGTVSPTTVVMNGNKDVTATFAVNPPVGAIADLSATQVRTGNPAGSTTQITLNWTATPSGTTVKVFRIGFGDYPQYDDGTGHVPAAPGAYPPAGWTEAADVTAPGDNDLPLLRDYYYYVAYVQDVYGTWSDPSNVTTGTLNYHLGDVSDGYTAGLGDNHVRTEDISLLGFHYGLTGGAVDPYGYLDVGPTSTMYVDGLPTTDNKIDFEDLMIFGMNYEEVSLAKDLPAVAAISDDVTLQASDRVASGTTAVQILMHGSGWLRGISVTLGWDPAVVEPAGHAAGSWLTQQRGVLFSAAPGVVDATVLRSDGMTGEGLLGTVTFKVLAAGDPMFRIESVDGRDLRNRKTLVNVTVRPLTPTVTQLEAARPNPFRQTATIAFSLATSSPVDLTIYSVDGRRVRTLARDTRDPGEYSIDWNGRDESGNAVAAGVYYAHLVTAQGRFTRAIAYLR